MRSFALLLFVAAATAPWLSLAASRDPGPLRLDPNIKPLRYEVDLTIDPQQTEFQGRISITIDFPAHTRRFWLHASGLAVQHAAIQFDTYERTVETKTIASDRLQVSLPEEASAGPATLTLDYTGHVSSDEMSGIFRQKSGPDWYVFTQFEALDARRAFPCFDEPRFKTPWRLQLHVPEGLTAASNSPITRERPEANNHKLVTFAPTRPLPSYLIAFVVGPFDIVTVGEAGTRHTPLRLLVPKGRTPDTRYAAASMPKLLELNEQYFGEPFPYDKLDAVSIPKFPGAMENAGLITFQESLLLTSPADETPSQKREYAVTMAHEMAHHWVGDLVTMAWWDDIWLNEGFASWMEDKIVGEWQPDWREDLQRVHNRDNAMESDSLSTARRIREPIQSNDDVLNAFDSITYLKGAAVLWMFENYLGADKFQTGVRAYLQAHRDGTATSDDFLHALSEAAGQNIAPAFHSFLDQRGVPEISAKLNCTAGAQPAALELKQDRYRRIAETNTEPARWEIPFCYRTGDSAEGSSSCTLLREAAQTIPLTSCPAYVEADAGARGYYRVNYGPDLARRLMDERQHLTIAEQIGWLDGIGAEVRRGSLPAGDVLPLIHELSHERDRYLYADVLDLAFSLHRLVPEAQEPAYARFLREEFGERARAIGWQSHPGEPDDERLLRPALLSLVAAQGQDMELVRAATELARQWLKDRSGLPADMVEIALHVAVEHGDDALREEYVNAWRRAKDQRDRDVILVAMGGFPDPILMKVLNWILQPEVSAAEAGTALTNVGLTPASSRTAFAFVREHFPALIKKLPRDDEGDVIEITHGFCDTASAREVEKYFQDRARQLPGASRVVRQTVETIRQCSAYQDAQGASLAAALAARGQTTHR